MAEGIAEALGLKRTTVKFRGKEHQVTRSTNRDMAALQTRLEKIRDRAVTAEEVYAESATPRGVAFLFWHSLRRIEPDITEDEAGDLYDAGDGEAVARVIAAMGMAGGDEDANPPTSS